MAHKWYIVLYSGNCFYYTPGKVLTIRVVIFIWWGKLQLGRESGDISQWRMGDYISLMTVLIEWMHMLFADNLVMTHDVSLSLDNHSRYIYYGLHFLIIYSTFFLHDILWGNIIFATYYGFLTTDSYLDTSYSNAHFGQGVGAILLHCLRCTGSEYHLLDCGNDSTNTQNHHSNWSVSYKNGEQLVYTRMYRIW